MYWELMAHTPNTWRCMQAQRYRIKFGNFAGEQEWALQIAGGIDWRSPAGKGIPMLSTREGCIEFVSHITWL